MHRSQIHSSPARTRWRWAMAAVLSAGSGLPPCTVTGFPEFAMVVLMPLGWVALLGPALRAWSVPRQMVVCAGLAFLHPVVRLASSSWHDGFNWFVYLFRVERSYQIELMILLLWPCLAAACSAAMLHWFRPDRWRAAENSNASTSSHSQ